MNVDDILGPYRILGKLGAGGMGEVYRARDTKLDRDVAIKVLPESFALDADRLARFTREAKTLAALNHPNIAAIYGLEGDGPGSPPGKARPLALVMELVEGRDLSEIIAAGSEDPALHSDSAPRRNGAPGLQTRGIPIADALPIARQIADALEAAHDQGIIHRDLKPANVKVRADGVVKVLDFGLAKALDANASSASADAMNSPTLTARATQMGMILGTAAYMAPEQARGKAVDKRADIWAFGIVLYEMLAGCRTFEGEEISDVLAAVLRQDIDWSRLPAATPAAVVALLRRCLERDPKRRLRDMGEARLALEPNALAAADSHASLAAGAGAAIAPLPRRRANAMAYVAAALLVALLAVTLKLWFTGRGDEAPVSRTSIVLPLDGSINLSVRPILAVSPDGSMIVMVVGVKGVTQLYVRPTNEFDMRPIAGTEDAAAPFFSPNGAEIGFFSAGSLRKVAVGGGPIITLAPAPDPRGGAWIGDTIIYSPEATTPLMKIAAAGGSPAPVAPLDAARRERTHRWPSALPDGKTVLFTVGSVAHTDDYDDASIEAVRLDTGVRTPLVKGRMARYVPSGHLLFARGALLYAVPFDLARLAIDGTPVPVVDGVSGDTTTGATHFDVSRTGTLIYVPGGNSTLMRTLSWTDRKGTLTPIDVPAALYCDPHVAPDGRHLAVSIFDTGSTRDVWTIDTVRGTSSKLTFGGVNRSPIWSRDGRTLYYASYDPVKNATAVMRRAGDGSGQAEQVRELDGQVYLDDCSLDNATLILESYGATAASAAGNSKVMALSLKNPSAEPVVLVKTAGQNWASVLSPDGRWLAYVAPETGHDEVYVQSASGARQAQISTTGGSEPRWSADGRTLFYFRQPDTVVGVPIDAGPVFGQGRSEAVLTGLASWNFDTAQTYNVSPVGDRFVIMRPVDKRGSVPTVHVVINWFADLTRAMAPASRR